MVNTSRQISVANCGYNYRGTTTLTGATILSPTHFRRTPEVPLSLPERSPGEFTNGLYAQVFLRTEGADSIDLDFSNITLTVTGVSTSRTRTHDQVTREHWSDRYDCSRTPSQRKGKTMLCCSCSYLETRILGQSMSSTARTPAPPFEDREDRSKTRFDTSSGGKEVTSRDRETAGDGTDRP